MNAITNYKYPYVLRLGHQPILPTVYRTMSSTRPSRGSTEYSKSPGRLRRRSGHETIVEPGLLDTAAGDTILWPGIRLD